MKNLYLVIKRRKDGSDEIFSTDDLTKAISAQKALIEYDELTAGIIRRAKETITDEEVQEVSANIKKANYDRLYSDDNDVFIVFLPGRK